MQLAPLVVALLLAPSVANACTTFLLRGDAGPVVGKSYDWDNGLGLVVANRRGVAKQGLALRPGEETARWVSRYASVTFNQYGQELPNGGMNEKGLVVEVMWLAGSVYPEADDRPAINELQWIQYQLDVSATVAEVVASAPKLRVSPAYARVHTMACDVTGACATFEYLDGELVVHAGDALPFCALTNHTYAESVSWLAWKGGAALPGKGSLPRFARAARAASAPPGPGATERAFSVLDDVRQGSYTKWNIVYEPSELRVHYATYDRKAWKSIDLHRLLGDCHAAALALDMNESGLSGDVTDRLVPLTPRVNRSLVEKSIAKLGAPIPKPLVEGLVRYPETLRCTLE